MDPLANNRFSSSDDRMLPVVNSFSIWNDSTHKVAKSLVAAPSQADMTLNTVIDWLIDNLQ